MRLLLVLLLAGSPLAAAQTAAADAPGMNRKAVETALRQALDRAAGFWPALLFPPPVAPNNNSGSAGLAGKSGADCLTVSRDRRPGLLARIRRFAVGPRMPDLMPAPLCVWPQPGWASPSPLSRQLIPRAR
jgi:hypothetical protein